MVNITAIILFSAIILVLIVVVFRQLRIQRRLKSYITVLSDRSANFYGRSSSGPGQIRGNGWLALTKDSLIFEMYLPARSLIIPLEAITNVDTASAHLGKSGKAAKPLLRIQYTAGAQVDSVAWSVDQLPQWVAALTDRRKRQ